MFVGSNSTVRPLGFTAVPLTASPPSLPLFPPLVNCCPHRSSPLSLITVTLPPSTALFSILSSLLLSQSLCPSPGLFNWHQWCCLAVCVASRQRVKRPFSFCRQHASLCTLVPPSTTLTVWLFEQGFLAKIAVTGEKK